jgi:response regulator RpfG family c-di-GMP phosphodiesterase
VKMEETMRPDRDVHLVVCVDDEPAVLSALTRALRHEPYRLLTTGSPETVLEWVASRDISVLISDQRMPGMAGTDLMQEVRKRSPETARVILTAYPEEVFHARGVRSGTDCLIGKPWDGGLLKRTVRQLLFDRDLAEREDRALNRP